MSPSHSPRTSLTWPHSCRPPAWAILLLSLCLFPSCKETPVYPASKDAWKLTNPAKYAEAEKHNYNQDAITLDADNTIAAPPGIIAPELYGVTSQIYDRINAKDIPGSPASYTLTPPALPGSSLEMIYLPGGTFLMGSPDNEQGRNSDESPQRQITLSPFWISSIEIPWEFYQSFMDNGRPRSKDGRPLESGFADELQDDVSQPTAPYTAMNLGMGNGYEKGFPAIAMSHYAASKFCEWLSAQTGEYYRLPTEAEWEYACRAGTSTAYSFGNTEDKLPDYAWYYDNGQDQYQRTGTKKPNPWGIHDMHGNISEWVLDSYTPPPSGQASSPAKDPVSITPGAPHLVRGGSWDDDPPALRSAARRPSTPNWNSQDPQNPKSIWYLTDGATVGFRIVRPLSLPPLDTMHIYWNYSKGQP